MTTAGRILCVMTWMALGTAVLGTSATDAAEPQKKTPTVDYVRDVKPLLETHCTYCHGPDTQESGLRLDTATLAKQGGDRGAGLVAGDSGKSLIYQAMIGKGKVSSMPYELPMLDDEELEVIRRWIDSGAKAPEEAHVAAKKSDHWSFQPIRNPKPPEVRHEKWVRNDIDRFILARLEAKGLEPSEEADRTTQLRRVSLDLRGLPPTLDEIDEFLGDDQSGAYERMVDRMLASPHYGERWGRHWLDLARYGDSNGFTIDSARVMWKYRDWVIDAFNADMPFDQFTTEQLAGDMLPEPTRAQLIATGFHRNTLYNQEGGTDREQFRVEAVVDRVNTTGTVFLGLTVGCAHCHTHKFDPITQREYFRMFAIFNNCSEPRIRVANDAQQRTLDDFADRLAAARKKLAKHDERLAKAFPEWERRISAVETIDWATPSAFESTTAEHGTELERIEDGSLLATGAIPAQDNYTVTIDTPLERITAIRLEVLTHDSLPGKGPGLAPNGNFILGEFEVAAAPLDSPNDFESVKLARATADHSQDGHDVSRAIDGDPAQGWAINVNDGSLHVDRVATFHLARPIAHPQGSRLRIVLRNGERKYAIGRFRLSLTGANDEAFGVPVEVRDLVRIPADERTKKQQKELLAKFAALDPTHRQLATAADRLEKERDGFKKSIPTALVMRESQPRETFVHIRGDFLNHGDKVSPGVPAVLPSFAAGIDEPTRLDLARWLFAPENPLTARVTVNRFWQRFFGTGIVATENDFGTQGDPPTHPELLDWLATRFRDEGWSMKAMHRLIVTSATYRRSSRMNPELRAADPRNTLLGRQRRLRLDAEIVRDVALVASGLFAPKIGGPSVFPPQPGGLDKFTQSPKNWKADTDEDRYRRGMYTFFWRSSPHPFLMTFDAPDGNATCTRRERSNTPLQALTLANDSMFVEFAQGLAKRIMNMKESDPASRLERAFRICMARRPNDRELAMLLEFQARQQRAFAEDSKQAAKFAPQDRPASVSPSEAAAWTATARVMLNLDEFITRE